MGLGVRVDFCHFKKIPEDLGVASEAGEVQCGVPSLKLQLGVHFLVQELQDVKVTVPDREEDWSPTYG